MATLKLSDDNDVVFENGVLQLVDGLELLLQDLKTRFEFIRNTWRFAMGFGIPSGFAVATKFFNQAQFDQAFSDLALSTPGVTGIISIESTIDRSARKLTTVIRLRTIYGEAEFNSAR